MQVASVNRIPKPKPKIEKPPKEESQNKENTTDSSNSTSEKESASEEQSTSQSDQSTREAEAKPNNTGDEIADSHDELWFVLSSATTTEYLVSYLDGFRPHFRSVVAYIANLLSIFDR